ncbi:hypothetical protein [Nocardia sp. NPDC051570]|uniref:hypothetical protein n=1 Tax=Nocardia sp. NPDC051570 TaxID=3364324 RepID=UPI0037AA424C
MLHALGGVFAIVSIAMFFVAVVALIRGRISLLHIGSRLAGVVVLVASFAVFIAAGLMLGPSKSSTPTAVTTTTTTTSTSSTSRDVAPTTTAPPTPFTQATTTGATTTTIAPSPTTSDAPEAAPVVLSCSDIGGVFVAHGTDGRGDCMSADPRPKCHVSPAEQDPNYVAEMTMTPPFPTGTIDYPFLLDSASNKDCWHVR